MLTRFGGLTIIPGPISSFFPFVSEDLTSNQGIMYGINLHNNNLVIFDRFSLENANQVVFAKSGFFGIALARAASTSCCRMVPGLAHISRATATQSSAPTRPDEPFPTRPGSWSSERTDSTSTLDATMPPKKGREASPIGGTPSAIPA